MTYDELETLDDARPQEGVKSSPIHVPAPLRHLETANDYPHVVVQLDARTRVIAADIQWIIQRRRGEAWHNKWFCRSKVGLLRFVPPVPEIMALPDWFPA